MVPSDPNPPFGSDFDSITGSDLPVNLSPLFGSDYDSILGSDTPLDPNPSFGSDNDSISGSDPPALDGSSQQQVIPPPPTLPPTPPTKRRRSQPPGTNNHQTLTPNGKETISETVNLSKSSIGELIPSCTRVSSELYRITALEGEDIVPKIECFSQQCTKGIYIASASGSVSTPTFLQSSCELCTHEGKFDIVAMSISYLAETDESFKNGKLSAMLVGPKGQRIGGTIGGSFKAATPVQVIVGSCISESEVPKIEEQQQEDEDEEKEKEEEDFTSYFSSEPPRSL